MARRLIALIGIRLGRRRPAPPGAAGASDQRRPHAAAFYFARTSNPVQVTFQAGKDDPMRRVRPSRRENEEPRMGCGAPSPGS